MVVVAIWHIIINWKVMKNYLFKKESLISIFIVAIIAGGTIFNIQPFKSIMDLEEYIKSSWEEKSLPFAHAELMPLDEFCQKMNIPLNQAIRNLKAKNIKFKINETLKNISKNNNTTPNKIYEIIKTSSFAGKGYGRMSLEEVCKKENIDINKAIEILQQNNIKATKEQTLKEIANQNNLMPIDIINIILNH